MMEKNAKIYYIPFIILFLQIYTCSFHKSNIVKILSNFLINLMLRKKLILLKIYYFRFIFSRVYNEGILSTTWLLHFRYEYIINDELHDLSKSKIIKIYIL